jgi:Flp pilus assembly protein TadG
MIMRRSTTHQSKGSTMVEFALAAPVLLLLLAGVLNYALALRTAIAVSDAARAGAHYGSLTTSNASDTAGIQAAARNAVPNLTGMMTTPVRSCKCSNGSAVSCTGSCGGPMSIYIEVTTAATAPNWFSYPGLAFSGAISAKAVMRAR